ncbi:sodium/hydrogen exchanger [Chloropicon primus]|uniref:Sodium/hydrogen exchanger n=1 Tax=Chloropicon primus TaxID=1764295 RepID=A0A5B8MS02_9CHLO|nr:sodium/hydrogen exchanger [Chloropicon primus]|mmetsp:Transcript_12065/g.33414  ORF Transcript_12065/g.33414 Transcript_12065/m.33414 type:complete len:629 (+) Transcript_12065:147-2033(+)|eukprot:QDZ22190.1 sodium/hydrogen exchanger [Chloropicon primus]
MSARLRLGAAVAAVVAMSLLLGGTSARTLSNEELDAGEKEFVNEILRHGASSEGGESILSIAEESAEEAHGHGGGAGKGGEKAEESEGASEKNNATHVTLATVFDEAVNKEFQDESTVKNQDTGKSNYNVSLEKADAREETVVRINPNKALHPPESTADGQGSNEPAEEETQEEVDKVEELIDQQNNEYVLANPNTGGVAQQLDSVLLQDLTLMLVASSTSGMVLETLNMSPVSGYILSGSVLGPGGFGLLHRLVQIETISQLGVYMLLFVLGLEFKLEKLNGIKRVTLLGGLLEVALMAAAIGIIAFLSGGVAKSGLLLGATLSMSSTTIVLKSLEGHSNQVMFKRVVTGTLLCQDTVVGLLFALVPVFGLKELDSGALGSFFAKLVASLACFVLLSFVLSAFVMPTALSWIQRCGSVELLRLFSVAFCFTMASLGGVFGVSEELGAFAAGAIIGGVGHHGERTLQNINQLETVFVALFLCSIGIIMSPGFLAEHWVFFLTSFLAILAIKFLVFWLVLALLLTPKEGRIAWSVALALTPISEFAFVVIGRSYKLQIIKSSWYFLLVGVVGLSMLTSPLLIQGAKLGIRSAPDQHQHQAVEMSAETSTSASPPRRGPSPVVRRKHTLS